MISVNSDEEPANDDSYDPLAVSGNGEVVVFNSDASNTSPSDANGTQDAVHT